MKWVVLLILLPPLMLTGGVLLNRPVLFAAPGSLERLRVYLTTNIAETKPDHPFAELRTPLVRAGKPEAKAAVRQAMHELGWKDLREEGDRITAVVVSALFRFRDDVTVHLEGTDGGTLLHVRSASRVGKGDLAANARHLRDLFVAVERSVAGRWAAGRQPVPEGPRNPAD